MAMFNTKGLSEPQRKELALIEKKQRDSQKRLEESLPGFKKEYTSLEKEIWVKVKKGTLIKPAKIANNETDDDKMLDEVVAA